MNKKKLTVYKDRRTRENSKLLKEMSDPAREQAKQVLARGS